MKYLLSIFAVLLVYSLEAQVDGLPANPEPGKCYVKCVTQDEFTTQTEQVMVSPAYKVLQVVPATYKTVTENVLVKEASKKMIYHPATYKNEEVTYVSQEQSSTLNIVPAQFGNDTKSFETYPKTTKWEYTDYPDCKSPNPNDCRVLCLTEAPARIETKTITTLINDASTNEGTIPAQKTTYTKQVVDKPAYVEEIEIPAEYSTIQRQVVDVPARTTETTVPAQYETITKTVLAKKGGMESWAEIDCGLVKGKELNILWDTNSAVLTSAAKTTINSELLPLLQNQNVNVELSSYTDSRGDDAFNMSLSQRRADAVKSYLVSQGINPNRIISKGYGETRLKNNCGNGVSCSESEHQLNRRTEYRVIQ